MGVQLSMSVHVRRCTSMHVQMYICAAIFLHANTYVLQCMVILLSELINKWKKIRLQFYKMLIVFDKKEKSCIIKIWNETGEVDRLNSII